MVPQGQDEGCPVHQVTCLEFESMLLFLNALLHGIIDSRRSDLEVLLEMIIKERSTLKWGLSPKQVPSLFKTGEALPKMSEENSSRVVLQM